MMTAGTPRNFRQALGVGNNAVEFWSLAAAEQQGLGPVSRLPMSLKVLLENLLRHSEGEPEVQEQARALANWPHDPRPGLELAFRPARILMPDSSGIPLLADLAAMRDAVAALGGRPEAVNPTIPLDLVVDHSVVVDIAGRRDAYRLNVQAEYQRNAERYAFLRWGQRAFRNLTVIPPGNGICHQVNLESLARVVWTVESGGRRRAFPELMIGMDSHTPMVNSLGVLGWGVGGIEAATAMLGQPIGVKLPDVIGCRLVGALRPGVTTTDLVLTVTERMRKRGVLGAFVEFCGAGLESLALPERATLANMAPEFGATAALFPIDGETVRYLALTGRSTAQVKLVEAYARAQGLWRDVSALEPVFSDVLEIDLADVEPSAAGPRRPQDRVPLSQVPENFSQNFQITDSADRGVASAVQHGDVVIAAITSCTNTSNPSVMIAAGLLARNAVARGLRAKSWVKASLAPGSRVVTDYLESAGLQDDLDALGFSLVGYGCTTCMGNSGPLDPEIARAITEREIAAVAVLSGNRNFEARIHPLVRANYLVSPPLVVAYAIAGTIGLDLTRDPLGTDRDGNPVQLADIWPGTDEIKAVAERHVTAATFAARRGRGTAGIDEWEALAGANGETFHWDASSTFLLRPPFFDGVTGEPERLDDIRGARALLLLGDSITTDHISPVGAIPTDSPAGAYLVDAGVEPRDFSSYMARRVNHEVMIRGTFANPRLRNELAPESRGGTTRHMPGGEVVSVHEAARRYAADNVPLVVVAGADYGAGSSRDWAAKGTRLLGIRAVLAESFERIHRANLIGMGVLPLQFPEGTTRRTLGLDGSETFDLDGIAQGFAPLATVHCVIRRTDGSATRLDLRARVDSEREAAWYRHGGVLQFVLRDLLGNPTN